LDKKSITVNGIRDFSWSPRDNILVYWVAEDKDVPARVVLLEIPRLVKKKKQFFLLYISTLNEIIILTFSV